MTNLARPDWPETFMTIAATVARRGTCPRLQVGAVITDARNIIIATGYNGAPSGQPHCTDVGCLTDEVECVWCNGTGRVPLYVRGQEPENVACASCHGTGVAGSPRCQRTVHAEANALLQSDPLRRRGGAIYVTHEPCAYCAALIAQSGLVKLCYGAAYDSQPTLSATVRSNLESAGISIERYTTSGELGSSPRSNRTYRTIPRAGYTKRQYGTSESGG